MKMINLFVPMHDRVNDVVLSVAILQELRRVLKILILLVLCHGVQLVRRRSNHEITDPDGVFADRFRPSFFVELRRQRVDFVLDPLCQIVRPCSDGVVFGAPVLVDVGIRPAFVLAVHMTLDPVHLRRRDLPHRDYSIPHALLSSRSVLCPARDPLSLDIV